MFAVADTSVYIENFRTGRFTLQIVRSDFVFRCSSVVLHELRRGARSVLERRFVEDLWKRSKVLTPTERHWMQAAEVLNVMRRREHLDIHKVRELAFDVLIALSARSIGATLVTCDKADFETIRRYLSFEIQYWS